MRSKFFIRFDKRLLMQKYNIFNEFNTSISVCELITITPCQEKFLTVTIILATTTTTTTKKFSNEKQCLQYLISVFLLFSVSALSFFLLAYCLFSRNLVPF